MRLTRLDVQNLRCLAEVRFEPVAGLNLVTGGNGAGKTSLVEAMHLLGYGRSFRGRVRDGLVRSGQPALSVYAEWLDGQGRSRRAGLRHTGSEWEARLDGAALVAGQLARRRQRAVVLSGWCQTGGRGPAGAPRRGAADRRRCSRGRRSG